MKHYKVPSATVKPYDSNIPCLFEESTKFKGWTICRACNTHLPQVPLRFLHYHPEMEIGYCVSGKGMLYLGDQVIPYQAGDAQIILSCQAHYNIPTTNDNFWHFIAFQPTALRSAHLTPDPAFLEKLDQSARLSGVFSPERYPAIVQSIASIADHAADTPKTPFDEDLLLTELLNLLGILSHYEHGDIPGQMSTEVNKIMPALIAISKELENGKCPTIAEMAKICHFSEIHFRMLFTSIMGKPPKQYITQEQLGRASQMLINTDLSIAEVWQQTGFTNQLSFFRNFTKRYGIPPATYRKQNRAAPKPPAPDTPKPPQ